jgi:DNA-3-methyladenine glycosylase
LVREFRLREGRLGSRRADPRAGADAWIGGDAAAALGITREHNGLALDSPPFALYARKEKVEVVSGIRIGLTKAVDLPWRYGLKGSKFVSKPFPD